MTNSLRSRVRKSRTNRRRPRIFLALCAIAGLALAVIGVSMSALPEIPSAAPSSEAHEVVSSEFAAALPPREVYRHSVIDGGAYTPAEFVSAIHRDPVVADHYRAVKGENFRWETIAVDEFAYMSYRRGNQIYWTKHKVRLQQGETILTDGQTRVRSRCGNCISLEPMQPTAEDEPEVVEFDALTDDPVAVATLPSSPYLLLPPPGLLLPPPFGTAPFDSIGPVPMGPLAENVSDLGPEDRVEPGGPEDLRDLGGPVFTPEAPGPPFPLPPTIPPGSVPGPDDAPPSGEPPPLVSIPPVFEPPIHLPPDFNPDEEIVEDPVTPVPVPEPGTLLLIGGGGIGLLFRRLRSRS